MATMMAVPVQQYQQPMCLQCNTKPRHFDGAKLHDFCGRTCALTYAAANGGPPGMPMQPPGFNANPNAGQFAPMQQQQMPQMQMQQQPAPTGASSGMPQYPPQQMQQQPQQQSPTSPQMGQPSGMMQQVPMQQQMQQPMQQMQQQPVQQMQQQPQPIQQMQQPMQQMQQPMQQMQPMQQQQPIQMQPVQQMQQMPMQPMPMQMPMQQMQPMMPMQAPMGMQPMPMQMPPMQWGAPPGMQPGMPMPGMCALPGCGKPVFFDPNTNVPSMYCGKTHVQQAKASGQFITTPPMMSPAFFPPQPQPQAPAPAPQMTPQQKAAAGLCQLSGCTSPVYVDNRGTRSQYCGKKHMNQAQAGGGAASPPAAAGPSAGPSTYHAPQAPSAPLVNPCLICKNREQFQGSPFCGMGCRKKAMAKAPGLLEIPSNHPKFQDVANQFNAKWVGSPTPTVKAVYMVLISENDTKKYEAYKAKIEAKNQHAARGREPGNQQRRWHGTTRVCTLGENGNSTLCTATNCALCNIIRSSFDMKYASRGLFGVGIYTSATPSKSNGYISVAPGSSARPVLLNKVVVGKGYNVNQISSHFTAAPAGYDSVLGQLAADELIVYTNDAIRPAYLIMFA